MYTIFYKCLNFKHLNCNFIQNKLKELNKQTIFLFKLHKNSVKFNSLKAYSTSKEFFKISSLFKKKASPEYLNSYDCFKNTCLSLLNYF